MTSPAVALLEHGEWLAGKGRGDDAERLLSKWREIFERLGARPWLERAQSRAPVHAEPAA